MQVTGSSPVGDTMKIEIEYINEYDDYGGAFIVRTEKFSEDLMTLDQALALIKKLFINNKGESNGKKNA